MLYEVAAGGVLAAVAVPLIARQLGRGEEERADRTASALLTWAVTLLVPLGAGPGPARRADQPAAAAGTAVRPGRRSSAPTMIRVFAPQVPLYGIGIVLAGVLQAHRRFLSPTLAPLLSSLVVIGAYLVYGALAQGHGRRPGRAAGRATLALAAGTTLGVVALSLPLLGPGAARRGPAAAHLALPGRVARRARGRWRRPVCSRWSPSRSRSWSRSGWPRTAARPAR